MKLVAGFLLLGWLFILAPSEAHARMDDPKVFANEFMELALEKKFAQMRHHFADRLETDRVKIVTQVVDVLAPLAENFGKPQFTEIVKEEQFGTSISQITYIAMWDNGGAAFRFRFFRKLDGWYLWHIKMNTDIDKILWTEN